MGGFGSGRHAWDKKAEVVEDCLTLDVNELSRDGFMIPGSRCQGSVEWLNPVTGEDQSAVDFSVETWGEQRGVFRLQYNLAQTEESVELSIPLQVTYPHFGGVRWWFTCPVIVGKAPCRRRVAKLHFPPGGRCFGCRSCFGLTYLSCQKADKRIAALRRDPDALAEALNGPGLHKMLLAIKAMAPN